MRKSGSETAFGTAAGSAVLSRSDAFRKDFLGKVSHPRDKIFPIIDYFFKKAFRKLEFIRFPLLL